MIHWAFPEGFFLLIPYALLFYYYFFHHRKKNSAFLFSSGRNLTFKTTLWARWIELPAVLYFFVLLMIIIAFARPQKADTEVISNAEGIDIVIVLDTSDSMLIEDMSPGSRINAAKTVIKKFIQSLTYDRVALLVFSGESYTRVPLTLDYDVILQSLREVQVSFYDPYIKKGTAIGVALANATARLSDSSAKSKVIVFLTDGEDNVGVITPETALGIVKKYDIKVYTIGVGGPDGPARIPRKNLFGGTSYQYLKTQINEPLLRKIAEQTKGKYFRANNITGMEKIFLEIGQLEKSKVEVSEWKQYEELFPHFLKTGIFCFLAGAFLFLSVFWKTI